MHSDRRKTTPGTGGDERLPPAEQAGGGEFKRVTEAWAAGRLEQAEKLLERFARESRDRESQDPNLLRDYYLWTGKLHYRTDFGWSAGHPEDAGEDPADVIERVNC